MGYSKCSTDDPSQPEPLPLSAGTGKAVHSETGTSLSLIICAIFLTATCVLSVYWGCDQLSTVAFVVFAYANLMLLFVCVHKFQKLESNNAKEEEEEEKKKRRLKVYIWVLATTLNITFGWRAAYMLPWLWVVILLMAVSIAMAGLYALFIHQEEKSVNEMLPYNEVSLEEKV